MNYIGSKLSILNYIDDTIQDFADFSNDDVTFCDIFSLFPIKCFALTKL